MTIQRNWQELIKPTKLEFVSGSDNARVASVVAEPLERGYGLTLGNALRRVLLSSLQGAAVTAIQIDGILHEFSSLPGVREDITDLVLNVKEIALKMQAEGPKRLTLTKQGPGAVTAGDIKVTGDIEVLNPELVICHLDDGARSISSSQSIPARATSPPTRTGRKMLRSATSRSTRCSPRSAASPTRSTRPVRARASTRTS